MGFEKFTQRKPKQKRIKSKKELRKEERAFLANQKENHDA